MNYCSKCTYLVQDKSKGYSRGLFYCEKRYDYILATNKYCEQYCRAYSRPYYEIRELEARSERERKEYDKSSCYITTIVCDILGYDDNCSVLNGIRKLRDDILIKDEKYKELLVEYDILGPLITKSIFTSNKSEESAKKLYDNVLVPVVKLINNKEYEKATNIYIGMTKELLIGFGYSNEKIEQKILQETEITTAGHGKQKVKINGFNK